ncbi:MAG: hypothetical protein LUH05_06290 [Candidatus Gastranaerophilales bacterium]|nr:hypothetical protein [Candidatus Gastranaerophilales bacterium]
MINNNMNISFKSYVPVKYYAKNPDNDRYSRVIDESNLKKCHGIIVRNLNRTLKNNKREDFVDYYEQYDFDYKCNPKVCSIYDKDTPDIFLVTGKDVDTVKEMAKPVGRAKGDAMDRLGHSKSFESSYAARNYFSNVKSFLKNRCRRLKDNDGVNLSLQVFVNPQYKKNNELKGFELEGARFIKDENK